MPFTRRSLFGPRRRLSSYESSKGGKLRRSIGRDSRSRRLHIEPLEDRTLLSVGVGGMVWNDLNLDGIRDLEEPGVAGAVAEIFSSTDAVIGNEDDVSLGVAITDADGLYSFDDLPDNPNFYAVFRTPVGYEFTVQDAGGDDALDSDADAVGVTDLFAVAPGAIATDIDAGLVGDSENTDWSFSIGGSLRDEYSGGNAVAVDGDGNVYVTGYAQFSAFESEPSEIDFDPGTGTVALLSGRAFVAKYTSSGALVWAADVAPGTSSKGIDLVVSNDESIVVTGNYYESVSGDRGVFIAQLDSSGNISWRQTIPYDPAITISNKATAIALADDGTVCITGSYRGTVDYDPGPEVFELTSEGFSDGFVLKLDSEGNFVWAASLGGPGSDIVNDVVIAADGAVYVTGSYEYEVDFDPGEGEYFLTANENTDSGAFVLRLDSAGDFVWAKSTAGLGDTVGHSIVSAADGSVYVAGSFEDTTDFGLGDGSCILAPANGNTVFALKLDSAGNFAWANRMDVSYDGKSIDAFVGANGSFYVLAGRSWSEQIQFPSNPDIIFWTTPLYKFYVVYVLAGWDASGSSYWTIEIDRQEQTDTYVSFTGGFTRDYFSGGIAFGEDGTLHAVYTLGDSRYEAAIFVSQLQSLSTPTDILLSSSTVEDGLSIGTVVGELTVDTESTNEFSFRLVSGDGDDDNDCFTIENSQLITAEVFDAAEKDSYSVRVRATDDYGQYIEEVFTITVMDVSYGLTLQVAEYVNSPTPTVTVNVPEGTEEVPNGTAVLLDVDLNNDGDFDDDGELGYTTATLADGTATFQITPELDDGEYQLRTRSTDQSGQEISSPVAVMKKDLESPQVHLFAPEFINDQEQLITVTAQDLFLRFDGSYRGGGLADDATVYLDVDLNNDGDFDDDGEIGHATSTDYITSFIWKTCKFTTTLPEGTYNLRARIFDLAGNEGTSDVATMVVDTTAPTISIGEPSDTRTVLDPIAFTVTYDDPNFDASTLTAADVTLHATGTADGTVTVNDGAGNTRLVTISDCSGNGTLSISIVAGTASDLAGNLAPAAGQSTTFIVKPSAHTISNVVVAEAISNNGLLESNEMLSISWTVWDELAYIAVIGVTPQIPEQALWIDDQQVAVNGSFGFPGSKFAAKFGPLEAGTHSYTIHSSDDYGLQAIRSGTFEVVEAIIGGPVISNVVVAEAGTAKNGTLESSDNLLITWSATRFNGIASKSLTVDGQAVSTIYGPYGDNYAGVFGSLDAGQHAFTIEATDFNGVRSEYYGTFDVAATTAAAPVISLVVIAEAGTDGNRDGTLELSDNLVITWSATSDDGIASKSLTVDGQTVSTIYGPYGDNYAGVFGPLAAGDHDYTIEVTDANGIASTHNGTFNVIAAASVAPQIGDVVVAETDNLARDGLLNTEETLVLTWTLTDADGIASKSLSVDGISVTTIYGPYGNAYAGLLGQLAAGTHAYTILAIDMTGQTSMLNGTFNVLAALTLDASDAAIGPAEALTNAELVSIATEAAHRLEAVLGSRVSTAFSGVSIEVSDLPGNLLGAATDGKILIDRDAAGYGWFVDPTPGDDDEFILDGLGSLVARQNTAADGRADLLTTVMHEMGHILGYDHADEGLMDDLLPLGTRRTDATDEVFGGYGQ